MPRPERHIAELCKLFSGISYEAQKDETDAFRAFVRMSACAVSVQAREDEYLEEVKRWPAKVLPKFAECLCILSEAMTADPYRDVIGAAYFEYRSSSSAKWGGEFYTPYEVSKLIAQMTIGAIEVPEGRPLTLLEPACGAGQMVLCAAEVFKSQNVPLRHLQTICIDVNAQACDMCYLNCTLWGIPAMVIHGNTLSAKGFKGWVNPFWNGTGLPLPGAYVPIDELSDIIGGAKRQIQSAPEETQLQPSLF